MNILIIEDDAAIRQELKLLLENVSGHGIDRVSSRGRGYSANRAGSASARCKSAAAIRI